MNSREQPSIPMVPLNREQMRRFYALAPGVLEKRNPAFYTREFNTGFQLICVGVIPIVGISLLGWSPMNWLVFVLFGAWTGIVSDCIKLCFLHSEIQRYANERANDQFVSTVAETLRKGGREIPAVPSGGAYRPRSGLLIDLVFAPISTFLILVTAGGSMNSDWNAVFGQPWFLPTLVVLALLQFFTTAWEVFQAQRLAAEGRSPIVKVFLGGRGACLFVLMFGVLMATDGGDAENPTRNFRLAIYVINTAIIAIGLINFWGLCLIRRESAWLRHHLDSPSH